MLLLKAAGPVDKKQLMISKQGENLVFLLGLPRSGTTLLSVMLDGHSQLRCPPEPWLMLALESLGRTSAHSAADAPVLYRALKEFCDPDTAITAARGFAAVVYNQSLKQSGKQILIDKTPRYYLILPYLMQVFPRARYVILWRNPLDIAASMRTTWQVDLPAHLAGGEDHLNCLDTVLGPRRLLDFSMQQNDRVHALHYEQLVRQPKKTISRLLTWLGVPIEPLGDFNLTGGEFDGGDIGDKKILSTASPHTNSIGRWKQTFTPTEIATVVESIGPHIFTAMGYADVLAEALTITGKQPDAARSNAYATRLETSLLRRNGEYESVETFSDLTGQERRLLQAISNSPPPASTPVAMNLLDEIRSATEITGRLSSQLSQSLARVSELERETALSNARLDETRQLVRLQNDQAGLREGDWTARFAAQQRELESNQIQLVEHREQLKATRSQLESISAELQSTRSQLGESQSNLATAIAEITKFQHQIESLQQLVQKSEADLRNRESRLTEAQQQIEKLSAELTRARSIIDELQQPPPNRRSWPYGAPPQLPLPATLPDGKPWPKISVITPSFNQGIYIEQTILSVLNQNYPNLEYILIDGGSTDLTMQIVDHYRDRIRIVVSEKDSGQSNALNKGFARSSGEILTWLNSDDMLESGALAAVAMAFHTSGADMVAGVCTVHRDSRFVNEHITACTPGPLPLNDLLDLDHCWLKGQFFHQPEVMFTRDLWLRAGGYLDEKLFYSMDYELWLRFARAGGRLHVIGRSIALFRVHDRQKTFRVDDFLPELRNVRDRFIQSSPMNHPMGRENGHVPRTHLRVMVFNDLGNVGGAGIAHQRIAASFAMAGHEVIRVAICPTLTRCGLSNESILDAIEQRKPDIIFLGNIHAAQLDPAIIGLIARRWPTLQVLHDLYSLTGRCAYTGDCTQFLTGCDESCPTAGEYPVLDSSTISTAWKTKHEAMTGESSPMLAAVSNWTEQFARRRFAGTSLELAPVVRKPTILSIRSGVPADEFRPRDRSACRDMLNLPQDRFIVLFSSSHLTDARKGLPHLITALQSLQLPDLLAVCIGQHDAELSATGFEIRSMGYVGDTNSLSMLYSAADLFVGPSLIETFGQVFIEAAACGTPSIGYATAGGVADAIADGISGLLAPVQSPESLAQCISTLYASPALRRDMASWGRLWIENEYSLRSTYQRIFAQLNQLGVLGKLHLSPKVSFYRQGRPPETFTYLDAPPPPPTTQDLLDRAENQLAELQQQRAELELQRASLMDDVIKSQQQIADLQSERDTIRLNLEQQITTLQTQQAELQTTSQARISSLETDLNNVVHTRLWRMAAATYPLYQRTLGSTFVPALVKLPIRTLAEWLGQRKERNG